MQFLKKYDGKRVLITGHTGFKGAWLSIILKENGADVAGYSLAPPTKPNMFETVNLKEHMEHNSGDVLNGERLLSVIREFKPEFVFHLAAQPIVRRSYEEPRLTFETNVMGTINLLEAIRKTDCVKVAVIITSDKCYENREWIYSYREIDPMGGYDPYSASKGCAELVVAAYRRSFFSGRSQTANVAVSSARAGNIIGGGDWGEDRLVPDCVRAISGRRDMIIRNAAAIRPWQYVLEPLIGYLVLGSKMHEDGEKYSEAWNFGPTCVEPITVEGIVKKVFACWGSGRYRIEPSGKDPHEASMLKLDSSKALSFLGWRTRYGVDETVRKTVSWYKEYYENPDKSMYSYTAGQIHDYLEMLSGGT